MSEPAATELCEVQAGHALGTRKRIALIAHDNRKAESPLMGALQPLHALQARAVRDRHNWIADQLGARAAGAPVPERSARRRPAGRRCDRGRADRRGRVLMGSARAAPARRRR